MTTRSTQRRPPRRGPRPHPGRPGRRAGRAALPRRARQRRLRPGPGGDRGARGAAGVASTGPGTAARTRSEDGFATVGGAADDAAALLAEVLPDGRDGRGGRLVGRRTGGAGARRAAARPGRPGRRVGTPAPDEEVPWYGDENRATVDALRGRPAADARRGAHRGVRGDARLAPEAAARLAGVGKADAGVLDPGRPRAAAGCSTPRRPRAPPAWSPTSPATRSRPGASPGAGRRRCCSGTAPTTSGCRRRTASGTARSCRRRQLEVWPEVGHLVVVPAWGAGAGPPDPLKRSGRCAVTRATSMQLRRS